MGHKNNLISKGKQLSYLLRHDTEYQFDKHGWRDVKDLIKNHHYSLEELEEIVTTNDKQRYEFNESKTKIRARQGHSIDVDVELTETVPPPILFHGTATRFLQSIYKNGINKGSRKFVHLSQDENTAVKVGKRHGNPYVIQINAQKMAEDGVKFYLSNNNVWLTEFVDVQYFLN